MSSTKPTSPAPDNQVLSRNDADESTFNPKSLKFITIMIGMYMSVFLVALVHRPFFTPPHQAPN